MWRDPLDELIDSLEAALPVETVQIQNGMVPRLADLQMVFAPILFGSEEDARRIQETPLYQKVMAQLAAQAERCGRKPVRTDRATEGSESPTNHRCTM